jgi:hypothetical protein
VAVAYSNHPVSHTTIRSDTSAHLLADLDTALTAVGWSSSVVTGGHKYTLTSPQGYTCKVKIWDAGDSNRIRVQFLSTDETLSGYVHPLLYGVAAVYNIGYELVAGRCQFFLAVIGITTQSLVVGTHDYTVAGGIPYVPASVVPECTASAGSDATTQIWWSSGAGGSDYSDVRLGRVCSGGYSYCLNSTVFVSTAAGADSGLTSGLRIFPFTSVENVDVWYAARPRAVKYGSGATMYVEPYIGWGEQIRGQLWDAVQATKGQLLDTTLVTSTIDTNGHAVSLTWLVWNENITTRGGGGTYFSTLYLLINNAGTSLYNYAY